MSVMEKPLTVTGLRAEPTSSLASSINAIADAILAPG